jgi:hypothetical protein
MSLLSFGSIFSGRNLSRAMLAASLGVGACKKTSAEPPTLAPVADDMAGSGPARAVAEPTEVEMIQLRGSFTNLDDILDVVRDVTQRMDPDAPTDVKSEVQAMLLQFGFGPGFFSNIDLAGMHAVSFAFPQSEEAASPDAAKLSATIASIDPRKVIESTPPNFRPQPLGDGVWELRQNQTRLLMRDGGKELLLGLDTDDLELAAGLRSLMGGEGRRIRVHAENLPVDDIDTADLLGLPSGSKLADDLSRVVQESTGLDFELDLGTDRGIEMLLGAQAPVHRLGIEPLGAPRAAATALEGRLPARPVFVASLSWGDPALVHKLIDQNVAMDQVPGPFRELAQKVVGSVHTLLDQVANDVVIALYLDERANASLLVAADVRDASTTLGSMRTLNDALVTAVEAQRTMAGKSKSAQFGFEHKRDGLALPGGKADRFTLTIAKDFEDDVAKASVFLDKNKLDLVSFARGDTAVMILGSGARKLAADISGSLGKSRKDSLAQSTGLEGVRKAMGGCQICIAGDPLDYLRLRMQLLQDGEKGLAKVVKPKLAELRKLERFGESAGGLKVEREAAAVALYVPRETVYASVATWTRVRELFEFVDDPSTQQLAEKAK